MCGTCVRLRVPVRWRSPKHTPHPEKLSKFGVANTAWPSSV